MWLVDVSWQDVLDAAQVLGALAGLVSAILAVGERVRALRARRHHHEDDDPQ